MPPTLLHLSSKFKQLGGKKDTHTNCELRTAIRYFVMITLK